MKIKLLSLIIFSLVVLSIHAQENRIPRAMSLESIGDSLYKIVTVFKFPNGSERTDKSEILDTATIVNFAFNTVYSSENQFYKEPARKFLEHKNITQNYNDVNAILVHLTGKNYLVNAWELLKDQYIGYYQMDSTGLAPRFLAVDSLRNIIEIRANGTPKPGGISGKINPLATGIFITTLFGEQISEQATRWFTITEGNRLYLSLADNRTFMFLGRTLEEARNFIQQLSQNR